jgi:hypothetical protein
MNDSRKKAALIFSLFHSIDFGTTFSFSLKETLWPMSGAGTDGVRWSASARNPIGDERRKANDGESKKTTGRVEVSVKISTSSHRPALRLSSASDSFRPNIRLSPTRLRPLASGPPVKSVNLGHSFVFLFLFYIFICLDFCHFSFTKRGDLDKNGLATPSVCRSIVLVSSQPTVVNLFFGEKILAASSCVLAKM